MAYKMKGFKKLKEKKEKNNPYFVEGKDMSKVPIYTLEEENNGTLKYPEKRHHDYYGNPIPTREEAEHHKFNTEKFGK